MRFDPLKYPSAFIKPRRVTFSTPWLDNIPFAFAVLEAHRPDVFVELGAHTGISYCAFCQGVEALGLPTKCYAVDTWAGDEQAGYYGDEIYKDLSDHHDPLYGSFSKLLRMTFDQAVDSFADGTVDLLHIDGCHLYEAVKRDFETWLPKLSSRGVVLLHDTNAAERDFGVRRFFGELEPQYPTFELVHGYGLGVVCVGEDVRREPLFGLFEADDAETAVIRRYFAALGNLVMKEGREDVLEDVTDRLALRIANLMHVYAELDYKNARLSELTNSLSWRITAPLRKCFDWLKGSGR